MVITFFYKNTFLVFGIGILAFALLFAVSSAYAKTPTSPTTISVSDYGAFGDGHTDDTVAIIDALAVANIVASQTGVQTTVLLPEGTYRLSETLVIPGDNITIQGEGTDSILKPLDNSADAVSPIFLINGRNSVRIENLTLDGNADRLTQQSGHAGIILSGTTNSVIDSVTIRNLGRDETTRGGIHILVQALQPEEQQSVKGNLLVSGEHATGNRISNNTLLDPNNIASFGIRFKTNWLLSLEDDEFSAFVKNNIVEDNYIEGFYWNAVEIAGPATTHNVMRNNVIENPHQLGIEADKAAKYNTFEQNTIRDTFHFRPAITAAMRDQGYPEVEHGNPTRYAEGNVYRYNTIEGVHNQKYAAGIYMNFSKDVTFTNNTIKNISAQNPQRAAGILIGEDGAFNKTVHSNSFINVPHQEIHMGTTMPTPPVPDTDPTKPTTPSVPTQPGNPNPPSIPTKPTPPTKPQQPHTPSPSKPDTDEEPPAPTTPTKPTKPIPPQQPDTDDTPTKPTDTDDTSDDDDTTPSNPIPQKPTQDTKPTDGSVWSELAQKSRR